MRRSVQIMVVMFVLVAMFATGVPSRASSILSGSVSFDPMTHLYTYSYVLDNTSGPAAITELSILIDPAVPNFGLIPNSHSDPPGWSFFTAVSGSSALPPLNEFGTFWQWEGGSLPVGDSLGGFSFTATVAPTSSAANNYFVYSSSYNGGPSCCTGTVEYGHVVAPNLAVPEPSSLMLLGTGLLTGIAILRRNLMP